MFQEEPVVKHFLSLDYYSEIIVPWYIIHDDSVLGLYYISMSQNENIFARRVYNIIDFFSDIGGLYSVFYLIGLLLVGSLNEKLA